MIIEIFTILTFNSVFPEGNLDALVIWSTQKKQKSSWAWNWESYYTVLWGSLGKVYWRKKPYMILEAMELLHIDGQQLQIAQAAWPKQQAAVPARYRFNVKGLIDVITSYSL